MICNYKEVGGDNEYDELLASLCATMNRRILCSEGFNIPTYPGEAIYVPDMLVAILLGLSPSGTAFFADPASYFGDTKVENSILRTAETAGHTVQFGHHRHYLLANVALVGEAIMLAMRTHQP